MGLFDIFKKKESIFQYDESNDEYKAEIKNILFVCEKMKDNYEQYAVDLANAYESKLSDIVDFIKDDIVEMYGISDISAICNAIGKPQIDLDRDVISYFEHTFDAIHIIDVEFTGIFSEFYYVSIDG